MELYVVIQTVGAEGWENHPFVSWVFFDSLEKAQAEYERMKREPATDRYDTLEVQLYKLRMEHPYFYTDSHGVYFGEESLGKPLASHYQGV